MKKRFLVTIILAIIAVFILSACGGKESGGGSGSSSKSADSYDVGAFTVSVPFGWTVYPQEDVFGEQDAEGNYPIDPECILLAKGASSEDEAYRKPNITIYWYSPDIMVYAAKEMYDNPEDITGVTINGIECSAFSGTSLGYTYQFIHYQTDKEQFDFNILIAVDGKETGITWEDPDIKTIMESVTSK